MGLIGVYVDTLKCVSSLWRAPTSLEACVIGVGDFSRGWARRQNHGFSSLS